MSAPVAMAASRTVLSGKSAPLRKPKAAPVFRTCVRFTKPGRISTLEYIVNCVRTIALVIWSRATMANGSHSSRRRGRRGATAACSCRSPVPSLRIGASSLMALAMLWMHRFRQRALAALAQSRGGRVVGDFVHVAPAPLAFHPMSALDDHRDLIGRTRATPQFHFRHDEQHRQVVLVTLQEHELVRWRR